MGDDQIMDPETTRLYLFLTACGGNWRNTIYIPGKKDSLGYLMAADRDGRPVIMTIAQFQQLTGEQIDPAECCGLLTEEGFAALYAQYLLWRLPSAEQDPLRCLNQTGD